MALMVPNLGDVPNTIRTGSSSLGPASRDALPDTELDLVWREKERE